MGTVESVSFPFKKYYITSNYHISTSSGIIVRKRIVNQTHFNQSIALLKHTYCVTQVMHKSKRIYICSAYDDRWKSPFHESCQIHSQRYLDWDDLSLCNWHNIFIILCEKYDHIAHLNLEETIGQSQPMLRAWSHTHNQYFPEMYRFPRCNPGTELRTALSYHDTALKSSLNIDKGFG